MIRARLPLQQHRSNSYEHNLVKNRDRDSGRFFKDGGIGSITLQKPKPVLSNQRGWIDHTISGASPLLLCNSSPLVNFTEISGPGVAEKTVVENHRVAVAT